MGAYGAKFGKSGVTGGVEGGVVPFADAYAFGWERKDDPDVLCNARECTRKGPSVFSLS